VILIVGDYEEVSQAIARQLLDAGLDVRLLVDRPVSAHLLAAGAQLALRRTDLPASVGSALDGVERLCLAPCRDDADAQVQLACLGQVAAAGVQRVVKISGERPDPDSHAGTTLDVARDADRAVEGAVQRVDRPWTIVRHAPLFQDMAWLAGASVHTAAGVPAALVAPLDAGDVAMVAIDCLVDDDLGSTVERVTGPRLIALEECLGRLRLVAARGPDAGRSEASRLWRRPLDLDWAPESEVVSDAVARVTGEQPLSLGEFVSALAGVSLDEGEQP
jgi:uncharacterized protein YbjT (DUF2867 family)